VPLNDPTREGVQELANRLARRIDELTRGRVRGIQVEVAADRVVVHGRADSYHIKQLALQAVGDLSGPAVVELDIRVGETTAGDGDC
jgi:hypothetical protein